jgi:hypothetical protein
MIKKMLLQTIRFIETYQSHSAENYKDVEKELNNLKKHMSIVVELMHK